MDVMVWINTSINIKYLPFKTIMTTGMINTLQTGQSMAEPKPFHPGTRGPPRECDHGAVVGVPREMDQIVEALICFRGKKSPLPVDYADRP